MIPLKDLNPRYSTPLVTYALIALNVAVFLYQVSLGARADQQLVFTFGMIPARVPLAFTSPNVTLQAAFLPLFTSIFLHGGWLHLIGNMWFLWIFGDNIEDRFGHLRYLLFYMICGVGAGLTHAAFNLSSRIPSVGASGAISGVMGAYIVLFPRSRVLTLIPLLFFFFTVQLPAAIILGYWFLIQFLSGLGSLPVTPGAGVAFWAHVGGFVLGILLSGWGRRPRQFFAGYR